MPEKPYILLHVPSKQIKDTKDRPISEETASQIMPMLKDIGVENVGSGDFKAFKGGLWNLEKVSKNPETAFDYAYYALKGPFPAGEPAIAKDPHWALNYARDVLKGPFPAGEPAIARSAGYSYYYARSVINGRFRAGEAAISKSPARSFEYDDLFGTKLYRPAR